ncbi:CAP domain-containing protein [uncultured Cocleimonas sp.]|uniref:CAP domain-containing protein n=1 Tax=uncultured Cocleimonas sp. TaxID=1051587 RepID=UPI0026082F54|nr:CAP domain-containing protein [uncultured Cocleimonas sp.]
MSKKHLILSIVLLSFFGCNSSSVTTESNSVTTEEQLETSFVSTNVSAAESSLSDYAESEEIITEQPDIQQCNLTSEINEIAINTINLIRAEGRNCGSTFYEASDPIVWSNLLSTAAQSHSNDMAEFDFFSHTGSNGSTLGDRVSDAGYVWQAVGENISAGRSSLQDTINGWLDSPGHCANIMKSSYMEMAVACTESTTATYGVYWTQVFATQR